MFAGNLLAQHTDYPFVENKGQWDSRINYRYDLGSGYLFLEDKGFTYSLMDKSYIHQIHQDKIVEAPDYIQAHAIKTTFLNANDNASIKRNNPSSHYYNYILGKDTVKWKSFVRSYSEIVYQELYQGINLKMYQSGGVLKYDFHVSPAGNPSEIKVVYQGHDAMFINEGNLIVINQVNDLIEQKPFAYQWVDGYKLKVPCSYELSGDTLSYRFPKGYDRTKELIIDPVIVFSSFSGSTADNFGFTATYDADQNAYGGGIVYELGQYPTTVGAYQLAFNTGTAGMVDMGISKFTADGSSLIYSTYLGGGLSSDAPHSLVVNNNNELYIFGTTGSADYPVTPNAYDTSFNGGAGVSPLYSGVTFSSGSDIVVSKLSADGSTLLASTFVGGTANDGLNNDLALSYIYGDAFRGEILVDDTGSCYVTSTTNSADFPIDSNAIQSSYGGGFSDGISFQMNDSLTAITWGTFIGGSGSDAAYGSQFNSSGDLYITGGTASADLPMDNKGYDSTHNGQEDGFLIRYNVAQDTMLASTFLGTAGYDQTYFVQIDVSDDVYVLGQSNGGYPVQGSVYSNPNSGQFIHKLGANLDTSIWSTVVGSGSGQVDLSLTAFLVNNCGYVYLSGWGGSLAGIGLYRADFSSTNNLPLSADAYQSTTDGTDFYLMVLNNDATNLLFGTYFGGGISMEHVDGGTSRFDKQGNVYQAVCAGCGGNSDFPTTSGAWSTTNPSTNCNLGVFKFNLEYIDNLASVPVPFICLPDSVTFQNNSSGGNTYYWSFGDGDTSVLQEPSHVYQDTGTYEAFLIVSDSTGCMPPDTAYMTIEVYRPELITINPVDTICPGDTVQIQAVGGQVFSWTPSHSIVNDTVESPFVFPDTTTTYQFISSHYCNTDTGYVTVPVQSDVTAIDNDTVICRGSSVQRSAYGGVSYDWYPLIDIVNETSATPTFTPSVPRMYYVDITTPRGCVFTDSVFINHFVDTISTIDDTSVCIYQSVELFAQGGGTYTWTPAATLSDTTSSNPLASPLVNTAYFVEVVTPNGCYYSDSIRVDVIEDTYSVIPDTTVCLNDTAFLWASGGINYNWTSAAFIDSVTSDQPKLFSSSSSAAYVTIGFASGCTRTDSTYVTIVDDPVSVGNGGTICLGESFQLSANGGVNYAWNPSVTLDNPLSDSPIATPSVTTTYVADITTPNGCTKQDSVEVIVDTLVPNPQLSNDTIICLGDSVNLFASGAQQYTWEPYTSLSTPVGSQTTAYPTASTNYVVNFTNSCGTEIDSVEVVVNEVNGATSGNQLICRGDSIWLWASGGEEYLWFSSGGNFLTPTDSSSVLVQPNGLTVYYVTVTDSLGCEETYSLRITFYPESWVDAGEDKTITYGNYTVLDGTGSLGAIRWTPANGLSCDTCFTPIAIPDGNTVYTILLTDSNGCEAIDSVLISLDGILYVPNTFTPNGDGMNDYFFAKGENITLFKLFVFNRWGELLFETEDISKTWDGTHKGKLLKTDTYVWRIIYKKQNGDTQEVTGHVNLLR